ncbi:Nn.00g023000.m01.CDS01 [Neocucurbitaria sp. VM-36]
MALKTSKTSSGPMFFILSFFLAGCLPTICLAQDNNESSNGLSTAKANARSPDPSSSTTTQPSTTSSASAQTHTIQVGLADHKFRPEVTKAEIGDTVEFRFYPANHSVVRAEYGFPCIPYEMTGPDKQGFFTGFHAVDKVLEDPPKYSLIINDTDPVFFYCSAPGSCLTYGMVAAININSSTSIDSQHRLALDSAYMLNPGEPFPAESPLPSSNPASTSIPEGGHDKKSLSAGTIAGIVIASLSVVVLAALLFFFWGRTKTLKDEVDRKESTVARRVSPSSSTAMLEAGRRNEGRGGGGGGGEGLGIYPHYTPTSTYLSPQEQQLPQKYTLVSPTLAEHPAFTTAPYSPADMTSVHRASARSPTLDPRPSFTSTPSTNDIYQHIPLLSHNRPISPLHNAKLDLGPYGRQVMANNDNEPAPSYFEAVHRPGPVHVNGRMGPVEMEGSSGAVQEESRKKGVEVVDRPRWEEVSVDSEGKMS